MKPTGPLAPGVVWGERMRCMILSSNSQRVEKVFSPRWTSFQNFIKVLKTKDFNGTGHPSWVSRAHPSLPSRRIYHFIDSLNSFYTSRFFWVFRSKRWAITPLKVKAIGLPMVNAEVLSSSVVGTIIMVSLPQALTWRWTALPIISLTSTVPWIMEPSSPLRIRCSGRTPNVMGPAAAPLAFSLACFSSGRVTLAPSSTTAYCPSSSTSSAS